MNKSKRENSILDRYTLLLAMVIIITILQKGIPSVRIHSFDVFSIYFPIFLLLFVSLYIICREKRFTYESNLLLFLLFLIYICIGTMVVQNYSIHFSQVFKYLSYGIILYSITFFIRKKVQTTAAIYTLILVTILLIGIAAWEFVTGQHLPASRLSIDPRGRYASTIYFNRNNFGFFLSMISPLLIYERICKNNVKYISLILTATILCGLVILILNSSRAAIISYVMGLIIIPILMSLKKSDYQIQRWPRISFLAYFSVATVSVIVPFLFSSPFKTGRFSSLTTRWELMRGGSEYIMAHLTEPAGLGMFEVAVPIAGQTVPNTPHNWAIQLGVETGLIGLFLFVVSVGLLCDKLFSLYYNYHANRALPIAVSLLLFPINGLGPSNVLLQSSVFWIFIGLGISILIVTEIGDKYREKAL